MNSQESLFFNQAFDSEDERTLEFQSPSMIPPSMTVNSPLGGRSLSFIMHDMFDSEDEGALVNDSTARALQAMFAPPLGNLDAAGARDDKQI
jgi:hypothetical protein